MSSIGGLNEYNHHKAKTSHNYSAHGSIDVAGLTVAQIADKLEQ